MVAIVGKTLGNYQLLEQIGRGGMASVFKARNLITNRIVAVKILTPQLAIDETFRARFLREAQVLIELGHRHIVPILDYGESEGLTYIVMPFMKVGGLDDRLQDGPLSVDEGARIIDQIAAALQYAHEKGVVHRDIKPSNILMDEDGNAWLSDFGFAHVHDATVSLTGSALIGTPAYMAPEQVLGHPVTPLSDQYSLGVVLYQICTGELPHDAETPMAIALKHANEPLQRPRLVNPNLPDAVERVLIKTLAKEPSARFRSVTELNQAFQHALNSAVDLAAGAIKEGARSREIRPVKVSHPVVPVNVQLDVPSEHVQSTRRPARAALLLLMLVLPLTCWVTVNAASAVFSKLGLGGETAVVSPTVDDSPMFDDRATVDDRATADVVSTQVILIMGTSQSTGEVQTAVAGTLTAMAPEASHTPAESPLPSSTVLSPTATEYGAPIVPTDTPETYVPTESTEPPPTPTPSPTYTQTLPPGITPTVTTPTTTTTTTTTVTQTLTHTPSATQTMPSSPVPTKTLTATPTSTMETLTTPTLPIIVPTTATTTDPCDRVGVGGFSQTARKVEWKIGNGKSSSIRLVIINIDWPEGNKNLLMVRLSGKKLWEGIDDAPPTNIDLSGMGSGDNIIPPGTVAPLVFTFSQDAAPSGYDLRLTFANGCKIIKGN